MKKVVDLEKLAKVLKVEVNEFENIIKQINSSSSSDAESGHTQ